MDVLVAQTTGDGTLLGIAIGVGATAIGTLLSWATTEISARGAEKRAEARAQSEAIHEAQKDLDERRRRSLIDFLILWGDYTATQVNALAGRPEPEAEVSRKWISFNRAAAEANIDATSDMRLIVRHMVGFTSDVFIRNRQAISIKTANKVNVLVASVADAFLTAVQQELRIPMPTGDRYQEFMDDVKARVGSAAEEPRF